MDITGLCVYTNNPPAGAFRGFGVPQAAFACETNLDLLARKVGLSPWEIRYRNALEPGLINATGQIADEGTAINPKAIEGQVEGGIAMGLGYALREDFPLQKGVPAVKYAKLGLFRSTDMPEIEVGRRYPRTPEAG